MSTLAQLLFGSAALALIMGTWAIVQQRWLRLIAPQHSDALAARRLMQGNGKDNCDDGCCACDNSANCGSKGGP